MSVLAILFWCWVGISVIVLVARRIKSLRARKARSYRPIITAPPPAELDEENANLRVYTTPPPSLLTPHLPVDDSTTPPATDRSSPLATATASAETVLPPIAEWRNVEDTSSVATILSGISMPCDLAPLTNVHGPSTLSGRRAAFWTKAATPQEIGEALASELDRLGMTFERISDNRAVAHRDDHAVQVTLHRDSSIFPTAPDYAIVVEFEVI